MEIFLVILIGLCIGSFLNVCIYRIPKEESIAFPPSHCTNCGYELKWIDLIPVASYVFLKGKCKNCHEKISLKYPIIECINALLYMVLFIYNGYSFTFIKLCLLASLLIVIAVIDFQTKYVYNSTVFFGIAVGLVFLIGEWFFQKSIPWDYVTGGAIGFLIIWLIVIFTHGMGEGDADIALICGIFLGLKGVLLTLFIAVILCAVIEVILLLLKIRVRGEEIAFGPYLAVGAIISAIFSQQIITFYIKIFII